MTEVLRQAVTPLEPQQLWARLSRMDWEAWDPDVQAIEDVEGGLVEGGRFLYVLNNGLRLRTRISQLSEPHGFTWVGTAYGGLMGFYGRLAFKRVTAGTEITYAFALTRPLGWIAHLRLRDQVIHGVEEGLNGIIREAKRG